MARHVTVVVGYAPDLWQTGSAAPKGSPIQDRGAARERAPHRRRKDDARSSERSRVHPVAARAGGARRRPVEHLGQHSGDGQGQAGGRSSRRRGDRVLGRPCRPQGDGGHRRARPVPFPVAAAWDVHDRGRSSRLREGPRGEGGHQPRQGARDRHHAAAGEGGRGGLGHRRGADGQRGQQHGGHELRQGLHRPPAAAAQLLLAALGGAGGDGRRHLVRRQRDDGVRRHELDAERLHTRRRQHRRPGQRGLLVAPLHPVDAGDPDRRPRRQRRVRRFHRRHHQRRHQIRRQRGPRRNRSLLPAQLLGGQQHSERARDAGADQVPRLRGQPRRGHQAGQAVVLHLRRGLGAGHGPGGCGGLEPPQGATLPGQAHLAGRHEQPLPVHGRARRAGPGLPRGQRDRIARGHVQGGVAQPHPCNELGVAHQREQLPQPQAHRVRRPSRRTAVQRHQHPGAPGPEHRDLLAEPD